MGPNSQVVLGTLLAISLAFITVLYDCHVSIQSRLKRVPRLILGEPSALVFALVCGLIAGFAFQFTDGKGDTLVDSVLGLKQANPLLRGISVGLTVLVLIRSKLSSIKGAEIGGELLYNSGRVWVMQSLNRRWIAFKSTFNRKNLDAALRFPGFEDRLLTELRQSIQVETEEYRQFVDGQIRNVQQSKPALPLDVTNLQWQTYYRTLINLALDYAGQAVFDGWFDYQ